MVLPLIIAACTAFVSLLGLGTYRGAVYFDYYDPGGRWRYSLPGLQDYNDLSDAFAFRARWMPFMQHGLMFHGAQTPWRYGHLTLPAPPLVNGTTAFVGGYGASGLGFGGGGYVAAFFQLLSGIPHQYWVILGAFFLPGVIGRLISALRPRIQQAMYAILREYPYHRYGTNARNQSSLGHSQSDSSTRNTSRNPKYRNASTQTDAQPKPMSCNSHQQCYDDLALIKQVVIDNAEEMSNMKKVLLDITEMLKQGNSCGRKAKTYDHTKCWNQLDEMHKVIVRQQETAKKARLSLIGPITIANITPIPTTVDSETVSSSAASVASVVKSRALVLYHQPGRVAWTPAESYKFVSKYTDQVTASPLASTIDGLSLHEQMMRRGNVATFIFVFIPNANGGQSIITTRTQIDIPSTPSQTSSALPSLAGDPSLWSSPTDSTSDVSEYFRRVAVKQGLREDFFVRHEGASDVDGEGIGEGNSDLNSNAESVPPFELGSPLLPASSAPEHPASDDDDLYDASVTGSPPMIPASRQLSASAILSPPRNVGDHPSSILPDSADAVAAEVKQEETAKRPKYNTLTAQELEWERENAIFAEAQARLDAVPRYPLILSEARALVAASPSELTSLRRILTTAPPAFPTTPMTLTASPPTLAARAPTLGAAPPALAITPMTLTASPPTLATTPPTLMTSSPALVATPPTLTATPLYLTLTPSPPTMAADVPTLSATASPPTRAPRSPEYYIAAKETLDDKQAAREAAYKSSN